jgi:hypothetical protein
VDFTTRQPKADANGLLDLPPEAGHLE